MYASEVPFYTSHCNDTHIRHFVIHQGWFNSSTWLSSRIIFCIPSWPCILRDRVAESQKRAEWAWCSWSTGWLQKWRNVSRECACGCEHKNTEETIYCTQVLYWVGGGVVKSVETKSSVAGQFAVKFKSETYCWTQKLNKEDYGVNKCCAMSGYPRQGGSTKDHIEYSWRTYHVEITHSPITFANL
jgi:hypothetical protein